MNSSNNYFDYLQQRTHVSNMHGFDATFIPDAMFDFQKYLLHWSIRKGRGALFADCGLGKSFTELAWGQNIVQKHNKNVLLLTPLAVTAQMQSEGEKFGIECKVSKDGKPASKITITNYEKLHHFDWKDYHAIICDESSILKNFNGKRKSEITQFMRKLPYRLLCTATAAPNDFIELGTSSEALGYLGYMDMLNKFFKNDLNNSATKRVHGKQLKWRFKGHAEDPFWRWVVSWAKALQKPSDIGFEDGGFLLPSLIEIDHVISCSKPQPGQLFASPAVGPKDERYEVNSTIKERCEKVSEIASEEEVMLIWCNMNEEGDLLEKMIPDAVQVAGRHSDDQKEERLLGFARGEIKKLIIKPKIGAWGLNYQHCHRMSYFPTHSYEQYYQSVRRCLRFGQKHSVTVHRVSTEGQQFVLKSMSHKNQQANKMFSRLIHHMNDAMSIDHFTKFKTQENIPTWL